MNPVDAHGSGPTQLNDKRGPSREDSFDDEDNGTRNDTGDVLAMELRNPSDALQILALSGDQPRARQSTSPNRATETVVQSNTDGSFNMPHEPRYRTQSRATIFDDYELVQRGILRPGLVSELLLKLVISFVLNQHLLTQVRYFRYYHPYCPIVPSYLLHSSDTGTIQQSDHFLLTAILTIASRDDPHHSLTHRYCWDHAQRLLVDVLLAHPWTQTPRTVEGLLLLAEWLPHIQIQETASETPKNLFSEDRTAWSLVGLAVRHGYLQRLDQGAFPINNNSTNESKDRADQSRLIWACGYLL